MIQFGIATIQSRLARRKKIAQRGTGIPEPRRLAWIGVVERWVGVVRGPESLRGRHLRSLSRAADTQVSQQTGNLGYQAQKILTTLTVFFRNRIAPLSMQVNFIFPSTRIAPCSFFFREPSNA